MTEQISASSSTATPAGGDIAAERRSAQARLAEGRYDDALASTRRIEDLDVRDEQALQMLADIVIAQNREQAGMQTDGKLVRRLKNRPLKTDQPPGKLKLGLSAGSSTGGGTSLNVIQQLEAAIRDRPSIPDAYLQLAQAYLDKDRDYDAERLLSKGREATEHDFRVQTMWEEVSMLRHARRVEMAAEELKTNDTPQTRQALVEMKKDRDKAELDIFRGRVKRQGADGGAHYGLGICLQRAERLRDACDHFEKALADPDMRSPAALALGHCLKTLDDIPTAMRYYRLVADSAIWSDQLACRNGALAEASKLAAQMKLMKLAERYASGVIK
jgi:tetratricopeptide (TPR) repeat protein